jgi:enoyl-CoA hydratase
MSTIGYQLEERVAVLTLDDGKVNAMSLAFFEALNAALDRAEREVPGALVFNGRPGVFSAGLDLKLLPTLPAEAMAKTLVAFGRVMLRVFTFPIPTVAAVSGHAIAGGAILAFACDRRAVADGAFRLQLNETAIGLTLPTWAITISESVVPVRWRTEALLHARPYAPSEALERGLVDVVTRPERLLDEARALAAPLTALDQKAYAATKLRQRAMVVRWASELLEHEMSGGPSRSRG